MMWDLCFLGKMDAEGESMKGGGVPEQHSDPSVELGSPLPEGLSRLCSGPTAGTELRDPASFDPIQQNRDLENRKQFLSNLCIPNQIRFDATKIVNLSLQSILLT
jgi:hypothetical protein